MTYSYSEAFTTNKDKIRLRIGDTVESNGPRPDRRNFSDEELTFVLSEETTVNASVAHCFEILANEWTAYDLSEKNDLIGFDAKGLAEDYRKQAQLWRRKAEGLSPDGLGTLQAGVINLDFMEKDDLDEA